MTASALTPVQPDESDITTAVDALQQAGAEVVGVAVIVDRGAGHVVEDRGIPYRTAYALADLGLTD